MRVISAYLLVRHPLPVTQLVGLAYAAGTNTTSGCRLFLVATAHRTSQISRRSSHQASSTPVPSWTVAPSCTTHMLTLQLCAVGIEAESERVDALFSELEGKDITEVVAQGLSKLASVPSGGGGVAAPSGGGGGGAAAGGGAADKKEEAKKEEEPEEEEDEVRIDQLCSCINVGVA